MLFNTFLLLCYLRVCLAANYDIIWDQNYCAEKDRYPDTYKLPHNSPCSLCIDDVITLRINSTSNIYENLYRVPTETAMMNCNATATSNTVNYAFDKKLEITIRSGGSDSALSFLFRAEPYYFISTSDGTQTSAENDVIRSPNSCLQLAFTVRLNSHADCGTYAANCNFTTVFNDSTSTLFCSTLNTTAPGMTTASTTAVSNTATTATSTSTSSLGLSLVFSIDTTDSPELITFVSVILVFTLILIIVCVIFGVISLPLYWFNKISCLFSRCHKISCPTFNYKKRRDVQLTKESYKPEIGLINIGAPQLQGAKLDQESHYENWNPQNN